MCVCFDSEACKITSATMLQTRLGNIYLDAGLCNTCLRIASPPFCRLQAGNIQLATACMGDHVCVVRALLEGKADLTIGHKVKVENLESRPAG